jgi:crossover junction endodeoxyribonuclease RuvC
MKMSKIFIGIDSGLHGGVAVVNSSFNVLGLEDTPTVSAGGKTLYDIGGMCDVLRRFALPGDALVIVESVSARPGQGVSSMFSLGRGLGLWQGIIAALAIPSREVHPATWTKKVLAGTPGQGKARVVDFVSKMFPAAELVPEGCRKPRDGRADALALAYWGATL